MIDSQLIGARRLRALFDAHSFVPRKRWGQNFVIDPNTIRKVVDLAGLTQADRVLEIGAGAGSLTVGLAAAAAFVTAIETDDRLRPILEETVGSLGNVTVEFADAMGFPLDGVAARHMVGNLPYNLAATLTLRVLEEAPEISFLTVMAQREVGERLAAPPGSKAYGQTSVLVAYWGRARVAARISRSAFWPAPNVDSVLVRIDRGPQPDVDKKSVYAVVKAAFSQRRKSLRNSLSSIAGSPSAAADALLSAGVPPDRRAEALSLEEFLAITRSLATK